MSYKIFLIKLLSEFRKGEGAWSEQDFTLRVVLTLSD